MLTLLLRFLHVAMGAAWVGGVIVVAFFLLPSVRAAGPAGGAVMRQITEVRKMPMFLTIIGWLTILSGLTMYARNAMGNGWAGTASGITFGTGGLFGITALLLGTFRSKPLAERMGVLGAKLREAGSTPPPELASEMQALQASLAKATVAVAVFGGLAVTAMSVARYV